MKILSPISTVKVELTVTELRALLALIGPTSNNSRKDMGMSEAESKSLDTLYDTIDNFFEGNEEEGP